MERIRTPDVRLLSDLVGPSALDRLGGRIEADAPAITDGTTTLTWAGYVDRVGRLAAVLVDVGVAPGDRVGIRLPKSCDSFVSVHAVLRVGAVVVPLDPLAPIAQADSVLADAGVDVLIGDRRFLKASARITALRCVIVPGASGVVDADIADRVLGEDAISAAEPVPIIEVDPHDPAYMIYTSGSTGRPKGIVHSHASGLAYAACAAETYGLVATDRFANIAPMHFDQSTFELYAAPLVGGTVVVVPDPILRFPASVAEWIERERVSVWYSVPYLLEQLLERGALHERDVSSLRWVLYGGESFPPASLAAVMRAMPSATFSNVYGPAEVNQCTVHDLTEPPSPDAAVPIGRAWPAARLRVVDPDDRDLDVADGRLLVASPTLMVGYHERTDLTAAAVTVDAEGVRWYDTGDLVRTLPDGNLVFSGRVDNQVKLRGHRIELEAIDMLLREVDGIAAATVVVDRPSDSDDRLVALVVIEDDADSAAGEVVAACRAHLTTHLPRYAVPTEVMIVDALPRTTTDKVDRGASKQLLETARS